MGSASPTGRAEGAGCSASSPSCATRSFRAKHDALYASERDCARYDVDLCRCQDHAGALVATLRQLAPWMDGRTTAAVDVGCGTGKLTRLLARTCRSVSAFDRSAEVVAVARAASAAEAAAGRCADVSFGVADARRLPLADGSVDVAVAGWAISYLKSEHEVWHADGSYGGAWREEVDIALGEMERVLSDGGVAVVLETQGTATEVAQRSGAHLYAHLVRRGFEHKVIRTDYRFASKREALRTLSFFFGRGVARRAEGLLAGVADEGEACIVPECTGVWWRVKRAQLVAAPRPPLPFWQRALLPLDRPRMWRLVRAVCFGAALGIVAEVCTGGLVAAAVTRRRRTAR